MRLGVLGPFLDPEEPDDEQEEQSGPPRTPDSYIVCRRVPSGGWEEIEGFDRDRVRLLEEIDAA